jgi:hypothetical protein
LTPLCLFIQTSPIDFAVASGNRNRLFTGKLHVQITTKLRSPQCQTKAPLLNPSRPPQFFVTIYLFKEKKKRRGPKGPNPLSCKKKKKKNNQQPLPRPTEQQINEAKKRKRRSKKKNAGDNFSPAVAV